MSKNPQATQDTLNEDRADDDRTARPQAERAAPAKEIGGPKEGDPTRYGDWTVKGRCIDF